MNLTVIDLLMPVFDGMHLLRWIRREARTEPPVLVMTALLQKDVEEDVMTFGASGLVYKSIDIENVIGRVKAVTGGP